MTYDIRRLTSVRPLILCCLLAMVFPAWGETSSDPDGWTFGGSAYLWAAGIEGTSAEGDDIDIPFTDVMDSLEGGVMGALAVRKGKWAVMADIIYLSIHQEVDITANLVGRPIKLDVDVDLKSFVSTFGVGYRVVDDGMTSLDLLAGARYGYVDADFDADFVVGKIKHSDSEYVMDGIIGVRALICCDLSIDGIILSYFPLSVSP